MQTLLSSQYDCVKGARQALLNYCAGFKGDDLFKKVEIFNKNSTAQLLIHSANTYLHWLMFFGQGGDISYINNEDIANIEDIENAYQRVNLAVNGFIAKYKADFLKPITETVPRKEIIITTTPLQLFTHAITHEFHHKGQILTMSRLLGYTPPDTDVIRF